MTDEVIASMLVEHLDLLARSADVLEGYIHHSSQWHHDC